MSDNGLSGGAAPISGGEITPAMPEQQQVVTEVQGTQDNSVQAPDNQNDLPNDVHGLTNEVVKLRQQLRQQSEYNEFLKSSSQYVQPQQQQTQEDKFEFDPNGVPYNSDVQKIAEHVARQIVSETLQQRESVNVEAQLAQEADRIRQTDSNFDNRMNLAVELIQRDPVMQRAFIMEGTATGKLNVLEKIAKFHPLYDSYKPAEVKPKVDEAMERIRANSQLPPVLTGVQGMATVVKPVSQMTDDEFVDYFNKQKREI